MGQPLSRHNPPLGINYTRSYKVGDRGLAYASWPQGICPVDSTSSIEIIRHSSSSLNTAAWNHVRFPVTIKITGRGPSTLQLLCTKLENRGQLNQGYIEHPALGDMNLYRRESGSYDIQKESGADELILVTDAGWFELPTGPVATKQIEISPLTWRFNSISPNGEVAVLRSSSFIQIYTSINLFS